MHVEEKVDSSMTLRRSGAKLVCVVAMGLTLSACSGQDGRVEAG